MPTNARTACRAGSFQCTKSLREGAGVQRPFCYKHHIDEVEADDRNASDNQALAAALKKLGNSQVTEVHMATDHTFSDHRIAQQGVVVKWLESVGAQKGK